MVHELETHGPANAATAAAAHESAGTEAAEIEGATAAVAEIFEEDDRPAGQPSDGLLLLSLEGFEGPIDLLLELARTQKVDLTRISVLALAEQYLAYIAQARRLRLEIAADYLVMAAWLAYLKSRLLLPDQSEGEEPSGAELAARLAYQLQRLQAMREVAEKLFALPRVGRDFFRRGDPEEVRIERKPRFQTTLFDLLSAYGAIQGRRAAATTLRIMPARLMAMEDALVRLRALVGEVPGWAALASFLPKELAGGLIYRSAVASHFAASLELARTGTIRLRQSGTFEPIYLARGDHGT